MPNFEHSPANAHTVWIDLASFSFETQEQTAGFATAVRFRLGKEQIRPGTALLVLDGSEIRFHGMITHIEGQGWAVATDRSGSSIPALIH